MNNCFHLNIIINGYQKSNIYHIAQKFLKGSPIRLAYSNSICNTSINRLLHSSEDCSQIQKDGTTTQPSPQEVTAILRKNEFSKEFTSGSVKSYENNQLASNDPIEDTRTEALCKERPGLLMGVFDGHGGPACAQVISKRLFHYIAAALLPPETLKKYASEHSSEPLIETFNDKIELVDELKAMYQNSLKNYLNELVTINHNSTNVHDALEHAILSLDRDFSDEVIEPLNVSGKIDAKTLAVAVWGAVVCVAHIDGPHLNVANVGDCNAVIGTMTEENHWIAKKITEEHNADNAEELKRIWSEHPESEKKTVIRRNRLLGELAPLRCLGDYRYKWPVNIAKTLIGQKSLPPNYLTPPYLTAKPDLFYHRLTPKDKFLILASDGLWDMMTPLQAVMLVGEHMKGKVFFNPLKLPRKDIALGDINELLLHRKESLKSKPKDRNAATHLIRHAIGGTEYGVDHTRLAHLLSLPSDVSRTFRDDITVTVVYFDSEFLRQCPA